MIVRYSLCVSYLDGAIDESEDPEGEWFKVSEIKESIKGIVKEISGLGFSPPDDTGEVLKRAAVALEARRERIAELESELAERNKEVERAIKIVENMS